MANIYFNDVGESTGGISYTIAESSTNGGTEITFQNSPKGVTPSVFFRYIKSKLSKCELVDLDKRICFLSTLLNDSKLNGQTALYEKYCKAIYRLVQQQELAVLGYTSFVTRDTINKFKDVQGGTLKFSRFENFIRVVPGDDAEVIREAKNLNVFDDFWILYNDPIGDGDGKTNKDKIVEKDPIVFGTLKNCDECYYITDWIDQYCDLTFEGMVEKLDAEDVYDVPNKITPELIVEIKDKIEKDQKDLMETNIKNYREKERVAQLENEILELKARNGKGGFLSRFKGVFKR